MPTTTQSLYFLFKIQKTKIFDKDLIYNIQNKKWITKTRFNNQDKIS